jgi:uncharacterized protein
MVEHTRLSVVQRIGAAIRSRSLDSVDENFEPDVVWHYVNPLLSALQGDYKGSAGIKKFFEQVAALSGGTFAVEPVFAQAFGQEFVVAHGRVTLTVQGREVSTDAVLVWRFRGDRVAEVWDIPAIHSASAHSPPLGRSQ